ncbi:hypothetical protein I6H88_13350 [Elizabethkingia bruuniana]|uniref:Uncharacterized protein n=1 Tax=Elizabethkingia bruuniana TaxID=1756149 RepID=A0A7T7ZWU0_9FLAO|nr:hypothetical protein [Elizabethkingia bruuniana]KGO08622.1 hypothetical protein KS04_18825 [Elizabethkingia miricola]KUY28199.1 hypothetical protein ATB97_14835 [Elizabethkingia bruuniana]QDZ63313.1 hypothetical protein EVD20_12620 [Elizabethkingia bruuniana]QQN57429.1 hypothetical protein I6H88_13350 [Elizabethkingia bruuniana]
MINLLTVLIHYLTTDFYLIDSFRNDDDFLAVMLVMGALVFFILGVIGIVLGLLFILIVIFLISAGIISTSVLVGLQQKSLSKGFKTFFISVSILGSTIASVILFLFINTIKNWWQTDTTIIAGLISGIASGWILGLIMFITCKKLVLFLKNKYANRIVRQ